MMNRQIPQVLQQENPLWVSWHDTQMICALNPQTIMDYFCRKSNPFYDRVCNNETIRMQRLSLDHLVNMTGIEYILLHVAEPHLYVIRKQHRYSPTEATALANFYIINGMVYKAPDLANVSALTHLSTAFEETLSYSRYHPNKGYTWDFTANKSISDKSKNVKKETGSNKEEPATSFQTLRVEMLLAELMMKFPPPLPAVVPAPPQGDQENAASNSNQMSENDVNNTNTAAIEPKVENVDMKPPPEKKPKISN